MQTDDFYFLNIKQLCDHRLLGAEEEVSIFEQREQALACDDLEEAMRLRNVMITHNGRLVAKMAMRYRNGYRITPRELAQEGILGLIRAIDKFDYKKGYRFSTYATFWVRQSMERYIGEHGRAIRIPIYKHDLYHRLLKLEDQMPNLSVGEKAEMLGTSVENVQQCIQLGPRPMSLDANFGNDEDDLNNGYSYLVDEEAVTDYDDTRQVLEKYLAKLSCREEQILRIRFGFNDGEWKTLEQVSEKYGLTRERIRQLEAQALNKLKRFQELAELL